MGELVDCPRCTEYVGGLGTNDHVHFCALCHHARRVPPELAVAYVLLRDTRLEHDLNIARELREQFIPADENSPR